MKKTLDDLEDWLEKWILGLSNPYIDHQGPKCPYAKSVWNNNRAKIVKLPGVTPNNFWSSVAAECDNLDNNLDIIIVATETIIELHEAAKVVNSGVDALNCFLNVQNKDLWLMSSCNEFYSMVFIQRITDIDNASKSLEQTAYYKKMDSLSFEKFIVQRRILRERLKIN